MPVLRPQLPSSEQLLPYLKRIDEARYYSNHGQLLREFEAGLARHFGVAPSQIAVVANGTVALSAALLAVGAPPGTKCLLPSWTFVASAAAAWAANLRPHFADVREDTWALDPEEIKRRPDLNEFGAVMVVSPFGAPVDTLAWDRFTEETGIPVLIDGAAAFDSVASVPSARVRKSPIMISLHATKVFGVGEGAAVLSTDENVMLRFHQICNFGVWGEGGGQILGYNGKLSEYHAAVGVAMLENWPERRTAIETLTHKYGEKIREFPGLSTSPAYGRAWVSSYCNVRLNGEASPVIARLATMGVETRRWWKSGVHRQIAYENFTRDPLPVTERLADQVFGLPFFFDMTDDQFEHVQSSLRASLAGPPALAHSE